MSLHCYRWLADRRVGGTRTPNNWFWRPALYQLSYDPMVRFFQCYLEWLSPPVTPALGLPKSHLDAVLTAEFPRGSGRSRTFDKLIKSQSLCQAELQIREHVVTGMLRPAHGSCLLGEVCHAYISPLHESQRLFRRSSSCFTDRSQLRRVRSYAVSTRRLNSPGNFPAS